MPDLFESGFCVRQPSWHRKELLLDVPPTDWDDAREKAGLLWEPEYQTVFVPQTFPIDAELPEGSIVVGMDELVGCIHVHVPQTEHRAIVRSDTKATLAIPKASWKVITHAQMGELIDAYTEQWRKAGASIEFETAGSLDGGKKVWALVRLNEPYTVPGDNSETYPYAAITNPHDGSAAARLTPTQVRIVCANTFKAAEYEANAKGLGIVLRHSGDMEAKLEDAKASVATMRDEAKAWQMTATDLAGINYDDQALRYFVDEFIPIPEGASERTRDNRADRQAKFLSLLNTSPTNADLPDTAYKLVNAAGEYLDHVRPYQTAETYLKRTLINPEPIKRGVIKLAREACGAAA